MSNVGQYIKFLRDRENLSARQLSLDCGLSSSYVSKLENGVTIPTVVVFASIMRELKATNEEILFLMRLFLLEHEGNI